MTKLARSAHTVCAFFSNPTSGSSSKDEKAPHCSFLYSYPHSPLFSIFHPTFAPSPAVFPFDLASWYHENFCSKLRVKLHITKSADFTRASKLKTDSPIDHRAWTNWELVIWLAIDHEFPDQPTIFNLWSPILLRIVYRRAAVEAVLTGNVSDIKLSYGVSEKYVFPIYVIFQVFELFELA